MLYFSFSFCLCFSLTSRVSFKIYASSVLEWSRPKIRIDSVTRPSWMLLKCSVSWRCSLSLAPNCSLCNLGSVADRDWPDKWMLPLATFAVKWNAVVTNVMKNKESGLWRQTLYFWRMKMWETKRETGAFVQIIVGSLMWIITFSHGSR